MADLLKLFKTECPESRLRKHLGRSVNSFHPERAERELPFDAFDDLEDEPVVLELIVDN